ncbi:tyrosine-type recombinase/integrase [Halorhabdus amylolytica]|uniref:tyrosine-type recombinase/integrase n=1 Tax=Halorhabdus amylolytica TaxID=2559573 RepID=UPI0010AB37C9|nr:tyrosine-type recombinase/integrase [Halorhabdus amylolytica]
MSTGERTTESVDSNIHFLKPDQVEAMRDAAHEGRHGHRDEAIVALLYDTGLRRSELSRVDRGMLDLEDEVLRLPGGPAVQKDYPTDGTPDPATITLDPEGDLRTVRTLRSYLATRDDDQDALVTSRKADRMTGKGINDVVQRCARRAEVRPHSHAGQGDVEDVSAHTLRHSVAYRMLTVYDGFTLYNVRNRLRHSRLQTTEQKYDHFDAV